jgi:hypothetical protein
MGRLCCVVGVWLCCQLITHAEAGSWQQRQGSGLVIQTQEYLRAEAGPNLFEQSTLRNFAEVPIGRYTIGYKTGYTFQRGLCLEVGPCGEQGWDNRASGFNEAELFVSKHTFFGRSAFALRAAGILPTTKTAQSERQMGQDGAFELGGSLGTGRKNYFLDGYTGYRRSVGSDADQLRLDTTAGVRFGDKLLLAQTFTTRSLRNGGPKGLDFDLTQASLSFVLPLRQRMSLEVGGRADLQTRGFDKGRGAFFSLWYRT